MSLKYDVSTFDGFPMGPGDLDKLNQDTKRAETAFLTLLMDGFDFNANFIITGIELSGTVISAGYAVLNKQLIFVGSKDIGASDYATQVIRPKNINAEPILWGDGIQRDSTYTVTGEIIDYGNSLMIGNRPHGEGRYSMHGEVDDISMSIDEIEVIQLDWYPTNE